MILAWNLSGDFAWNLCEDVVWNLSGIFFVECGWDFWPGDGLSIFAWNLSGDVVCNLSGDFVWNLYGVDCGWELCLESFW